MTTKKLSRREGALERLQAQLKSGVKPVKKSLTKTTPLTEKDISRINREIESLLKKGV